MYPSASASCSVTLRAMSGVSVLLSMRLFSVSPSIYSITMTVPSSATSSMLMVRQMCGWSICSPISNSLARA